MGLYRRYRLNIADAKNPTAIPEKVPKNRKLTSIIAPKSIRKLKYCLFFNFCSKRIKLIATPIDASNTTNIVNSFK